MSKIVMEDPRTDEEMVENEAAWRAFYGKRHEPSLHEKFLWDELDEYLNEWCSPFPEEYMNDSMDYRFM